MTIKSRLSLTFFSLALLSLLLSIRVHSQAITSNPLLPTDNAPVTITFNSTGTALEGYSGELYTHTGVIVQGNTSWQYVIGTWGNNTVQPKLTRLGPNLYELKITPSIRQFYNVPAAQAIQRMAFVFRAAAGSPQSADLFVNVFPAEELSISLISPQKDQPIVEFGNTVTVQAAAISATSLSVYVNNQQVATSTQSPVEYQFNSTVAGYGTHWIRVEATNGTKTVKDSTYVFVRPQPTVAELPVGVKPGINYIDETTVTLVLHDPPAKKNFAFVIGDATNWMVAEQGYMKRNAAGTYFWITFTGLTPNTEYGFQYFIDGDIRIPDPYTHKVLDPWNDRWISSTVYPNLKPYPTGKTNGLVSIMHPGKPAFNWQATGFAPPAKENMVIYELHIRDFVATSAIKTVMDSLDYLQRLGVNVIELMPINEFEGNNSWGYNPALYFATDKAYGTRDDYKHFIDECHRKGIAVVIDIVLNHSFNLSPHVQMYFNKDAGSWGQPSADNPWFLQTCPHQPWCWGNTFDQNSLYTHELFNRITEYWLTEFRVDGFRFDFTKGFTNVQTGNQGSNYDAARIANLKRIANHIWTVNPNAYVILEHLTDNSEEKELAEYGMMLWGNMNHNYMEAAMGWIPQSDFSWGSYKARGWSKPHLISYMESHDEERMMYKNISFGNSSGTYDVKHLPTAFRRAGLASTFYFTIPGPKMIWQFGEVGYDFTINRCPNGTVNNDCRTDPKPIRWDYYNEPDRRRLFNTYAALIKIKKEHEVFRTTDYTLALSGENKRIHLNHASNQVTIIGNFGVTASTFNPQFQRTGTWYEFFTRNVLNVNDLSDPITLQPGEFRLYSTVAFPDHGLPLNSELITGETLRGFEVFPNPSDKGFHFRLLEPGEFTLRIVNLQGQTVYEKVGAFGKANNDYYWDARFDNGQKANSGIYFYQVNNQNGKSTSGKIVVK